MKDLRTILRDSALVLPVLVLGALWLGGPGFGLGVLLSGVFTLLNLSVLAVVVGRLTRAIEVGGSAAAAAGVLMLKFGLALAGYVLLTRALDPLSVAVGLCCGVMGMSVRPMIEVLSVPADASRQES